MVPDPEEYPSMESYLGIYLFPSQCEYTIMETMGPTAYIWGFLAARK
jgi:endoglucanase